MPQFKLLQLKLAGIHPRHVLISRGRAVPAKIQRAAIQLSLVRMPGQVAICLVFRECKIPRYNPQKEPRNK